MTLSQNEVAIVGFGSQAKAWALNLKDSNLQVTIILRSGSSSASIARKLGFNVSEPNESLKRFSILIMLFPDDQHLHFLTHFSQFIANKAHLIYGHGFSLSKSKLRATFPQFSHSLLAPKAIASEVRFQYETKGKIGAVVDFGDQSKTTLDQLHIIAKNVGINALYHASFEDETKADLFSEQSLLCSIIPYVSLKSYNLLRKNGIPKEVAFMECFLELKSISAAFVQLGPQAFFNLISPNALIGSQKGRKALLGKDFDEQLEKLWSDISDKTFFNEVEVESLEMRKNILNEWNREELSEVFKELKNDLIN